MFNIKVKWILSNACLLLYEVIRKAKDDSFHIFKDNIIKIVSFLIYFIE